MARPPAEQPWQHSHRIVALGGFVGAGIAALGGAGTIAFGQPLGWIALAAALPIAAGAWISAHFHGWTEIGEMVAIRIGWLKPKTTLLPFPSGQSAALRTDFILRPSGLATAVFGVPRA